MYTHLQTTLIFWEVVGGLNTLDFREYISRSLMSGIALYYDIHTHHLDEGLSGTELFVTFVSI